MSKSSKHRGVANPEYIQAMREIRRSSAASPQESRNKRERSRADAKRAALRREDYSRV